MRPLLFIAAYATKRTIPSSKSSLVLVQVVGIIDEGKRIDTMDGERMLRYNVVNGETSSAPARCAVTVTRQHKGGVR